MTHTRPRIQVADYATGISTIYTDWNEFKAERRSAERPVRLLDEHPAPCVMCQGQRRIWHRAANGEGLVPRSCHWCHGTGLRLNRGH